MRILKLSHRATKNCMTLFVGCVILVNLWLITWTSKPAASEKKVNRIKNKQEDTAIELLPPVVDNPPAKPLGPGPSCPEWCLWGNSTGSTTIINRDGPFYLTAVISVRVYDWKDLAKLGTRELKQWIHYLRYAGVEHVYLYDAYAFKNESQEAKLADYIDSGYLTYTDWHHKAVPFSLGGTQAAAYADCIDKWADRIEWQLAIDMDEYPFCPGDPDPGFLSRYLRNYTKQSPGAEKVTELSMPNYLFLGKPLDVQTHPLLIDRIWRRTKNAANHLVKPIVKPAAVHGPDIHHNALKYGERVTAESSQLRMNHYWGARLQNWGEDTPKVLDMTVEDRSMEPVIKNLYKCSACPIAR